MLYTLKISEDSGRLINQENGAEGGIFYTQVEGADLLLDMTSSGHIQPRHALELLKEIAKSTMPLFKLELEGEDLDTQDLLEMKSDALAILYATDEKLKDVERSRDASSFSYLYLYNNPKKACVYMPGGKKSYDFSNIYDGKRVIQKLFENNHIDVVEKEELLNHLNKTSLPPINLSVIAERN